MFNIGPLEIAVIALLALLVVGPKRLPEVGKMVAKSLRQFRDVQDEFKKSIDLGGLLEDDKPPSFEKPPTSRMAEGAAAAETGFGARRKARRGMGTSGSPEDDEEDGLAEDLPEPDEASDAVSDAVSDLPASDAEAGGELDEQAGDEPAEEPASLGKRKRTWDAFDGASEDDHQ